MAVAARDNGWPGWRTFLLILAAIVCRPHLRHGFQPNRRSPIRRRKPAHREPSSSRRRNLARQRLDSLPAQRHWHFAPSLISSIRSAFISRRWRLFVVCFYSLTKRFTDFTHIYLGVALALAPIGAWLAVQGTIFTSLPSLLALAVVCWLVGFDIIYALQDYEFDRPQRLHSLVVRWGPKMPSSSPFLSHLVMWGCSCCFGLISRFRVPYLVGSVDHSCQPAARTLAGPPPQPEMDQHRFLPPQRLDQHRVPDRHGRRSRLLPVSVLARMNFALQE